MKKVGILTTYRQPNWGSVLQAYALQKSIDRLGYKTQVIDYIYPNEFHYSHGCPKYRKPLVRTCKDFIKFLLRKIGLYKGRKGKMELLNDFILKNMNCSKKIASKEDLKKNLPHYDIYVSGSDQIWNPNTMYGDMSYMFDFVSSQAVKIAYSSSFSCDSIPDEYQPFYKKYLSQFSAISVRERNGVGLAKKYSGLNDVQLVLDPTFLIDKEEWRKIAANSSCLKLPKKYILFYMLAYTYSPVEKMLELLTFVQKKYACPIVSLNRKPDGFNGEFIDITSSNEIGIPEFLYLFDNADIVVTSSFHGTAFSLNFGKPFIALENGKSKADDRLSTIIKTLQVEKNLIDTNTFIGPELSPYFDVDLEQKKLMEERQKSLEYLKKALENDTNIKKNLTKVN